MQLVRDSSPESGPGISLNARVQDPQGLGNLSRIQLELGKSDFVTPLRASRKIFLKYFVRKRQ